MSNNSETRTFDALVSTTLDNYRKTLVDNITQTNALLYEMKRGGRMEMQDGGVQIIQPLLYELNSTFAAYDGYDILDTTPQEGITAALFPWAQVGGSISISRKELRQNSGRHKLISLIEAKIQQAELSIQDKMNEYLWSTGKYNASQTSKAPMGIQAMIPEDPDSYDIGGIDCSTETWWRNKVADNAGTTLTWINDLGDTPAAATGPKKMERLYNNCSKGPGGGPDLILSSQYLYEEYKAGMRPQQIYTNATMAEAGFENVRFRKANLTWDVEYASASCTTPGSTAGCVMINTKFLKFVTDSQTNFIKTEWVRPENQDAKTCQILWMGNFTVSNRRKHGVLIDSNITEIE